MTPLRDDYVEITDPFFPGCVESYHSCKYYLKCDRNYFVLLSLCEINTRGTFSSWRELNWGVLRVQVFYNRSDKPMFAKLAELQPRL